jgi:isocitrate dehydrogenase (NAD+)
VIRTTVAAHRGAAKRVVRPVTLIPGDGIGPEVMTAARTVIDASGALIDWDVRQAGATAAADGGSSLPDELIESIRATRVAFKGPTATGTSGERPVSVRLRAALDLELGVRPVRTWTGIRSPTAAGSPGFDILLLRMLGEDLYAGLELEADDPAAADLRRLWADRGRALPKDTAFSLKPLSERAMERFARAALAYARIHGRRHITIVHKATVMRQTDGRFLAIVEKSARCLGGFQVDERLIDTVCLDLVRHPERFDVLLTTVMYGDILSDLIAGLAGGLGLAPGANLGAHTAVFEPVHGTAPSLAGQDRADPIAAILTGAMLLRHLDMAAEATRIESAVGCALREARSLTYDLAGITRQDARAASTRALTEAVVAALPDR